jgi:hypothetical protein
VIVIVIVVGARGVPRQYAARRVLFFVHLDANPVSVMC